MPCLDVVRETKIIKTPRLMQLEGIFDIPPSEKSAESWHIDFDLPETWNVGLIVGPSGSGKSTVARELFSDYLVNGFKWSRDKSILDDFPKEMSIKEISRLYHLLAFPPLRRGYVRFMY